MSSPLDRLLGRLLPQRGFRSDRRPVSVFTPRRFTSRLRPLTGTQLTLATPESLETRQLWAVVPNLVGNVLQINLTAASDSAFVRVTGPQIQVASAINGFVAGSNFAASSVNEVRVIDTTNSASQSFTLLQVLPLNAFLNIPSTGNTIESVVLNGSVVNRTNIFAGNIQLDSAINAGVNNVSLTLASGSLNITAAVNGSAVTMSAPGSISVQSPVRGTTSLSLGAASGISGAANISGGNIVLDTTTGNIGISGVVTATGSFLANAPLGALSLQGPATAASALTLSAQNDIQTSGGLSVTAGNLVVISTRGAVTATGPLTASGVARTAVITADTNINTTGLVTANGSITYNALNGSITTGGPITSANGAVAFNAASDVNTTAAVTANSNIAYSAATGSIATSGPITSTAANVTFTASSDVNTTAAVTAESDVEYLASGNIAVLGGVTSVNGSVGIGSTPGQILIDSAVVAATTPGPVGSVSVSSDNSITVTALGSIAGTNVYISSSGNITLAGSVSADQTTGTFLLFGPDVSSARLNATGLLTASDLVVFTFSDNAPLSLNTSAVRISGQTNNDLSINNTRDLTIGTGVLAAGGNLDVQASGNILITANLSAPANKSVSINATTGSVTLDASVSSINAPVSIAASNRINGTATIVVASGSDSSLSLRAGNGITATTQVDSLTAQVTGTGDISIAEVDGLTLLDNVTTNSGSISLNTGTNTSFAGNLNGTGFITAGGPTGGITLRSGNGSVVLNAANNQVSGAGLLNITARNSIAVNSAVGSLAATSSAAAATITVNEADGLGITGNVTTNNGNIAITAGRLAAGDINGSGRVSAGTANVTITDANGGVQLSGISGQVVANGLTVTARDTVAVNTNVATANVTVTGALQSATIQQTRQLSGLNVVTNAGDITVNLAAGNLLSAGAITASNGTATGNVTLGAVAGNIGVGTITANILTLQARNSSSFNTNIATLNANITGSGQTFTLTETNGLSIGANGVRTNNGQISITAGNSVNGTLNGSGAINAGTGNVLLTNTRGAITTSGLVTGQSLTVAAQNDVTLNTNVANLTATISANGNLTVTETNGLRIDGAGLNTAAGNGSIAVTAGNSMTGDLLAVANITAGTGNVTLTNTRGSIATSGSNTIAGNVLTVNAQNTVSLKSNVTALTATITGTGNLSVFEDSGLQIATAGVTTANGAIDIRAGQSANGTLNGNGFVNAGAANVTLRNSRGAITTSGLITGNVLNVVARDGATLTTNVTQLTANITGTGNLSITETNGLSIDASGVRTTNGLIAITAGSAVAGDLNGTGTLNAVSGNVTLTNANGGITLTGINQVAGNVLTISAKDSVAVNTSVGTINATVGVVGGGNATASLAVNESTGLGIANAVTTGGSIAITSGLYGTSNINGTGTINATTAGNVALTNANGGITLTGINQVTGNVLTIAARDSVAVNTSVGSINASAGVIGGTNPAASLTVNESTGLNIVNAATSAGAIAITSGLYGASTLSGAGSINAVTGNVVLTNANGGITLTGANQVTGNVLTISAQNSVTLNASVNGLVANLTGVGDLAVVNAGGLAISSAVVTNAGAVTITAPSLALDGSLTAGGPSNVTLAVAGQITGTGSLLASNLVWSAVAQPNDTNWNYDSINATVTGIGNTIAITRSAPTNLTVVQLSTVAAPISLAMTGLAGDLTLAGPITAGGNENVSLSVTNGAVGGSGLVTGNVLNVAAAGSASLATNVASLAANLSGPLASLTVVEQNGLGVLAGYDVTATDAISILVIDGDFDLSGNLTSTTAGNVTLSVPNGSITGTGNLAAGNLSWVALSQNDTVSQNWIYSGITANVTGAGNNLTISSNGPLTIFGLYTHSGEISITPADMNVVTDVDLQGNVVAGLNQAGYNDVIVNLNGTINSNGGTIIGDALSLTVANGSVLTTNVTSLSANVTGTGSLWISEADNLTIDAAGIVNPSGDVNLLAGGDVGGIGLIRAINLDIAANSAVLTTRVTGLTASIFGSGGVGLDINQNGSLSIGTNGVLATVGAPISLNVTGGSLNGTGSIDAGDGDVLLNVSGGGIDLTRVKGTNLTVFAQNSVVLPTQIAGLRATLSNPSDGINVTDIDDLTILLAGVTTANGDITLRSETGAINGTGVLNAGTGNLTLNAVTEIDLDAVANQVIGNFLNAATTFGSINVTTNITRVSATAINGSVVIRDIGDLNITADDEILAAPTGNITIDLDGNLSIAGNVTGDGGGFVVLNSTSGNIATSGANTLVFADTLDVRAATSSTLNTSINSLTANITGPGANLTVTNSYDNSPNAPTGANLSIGPANVVLNGGTFSLTLATNTDASLNGNGSINAGGGNVSISAANGGVALTAVNNQIVGNVLTITAQNSVAINTSVQTLNASVTNSGATLTVNESTGLAIAKATTAGGAIAITSGRSGASTLSGSGPINATTAGTVTLTNANGGITLTGVNQVTGSVLVITARDSVAVNTSVASLDASAGVIGGGNATASLTVNESTGLDIANATTTSGSIAVTSGLYGASTLNGTGSINATTAGNVTLTNANGGITLTGINQVTGNVLTIAAKDAVAVNTSVGSLNASAGVIGGGNATASLTVNESTGLGIANAATTGGSIAITSGLYGASNLNGTGSINATAAGNVTLTNANGGITLTGTAGQITGNVLNVTARNSTSLNTNVRTLVANISGEGSTLTVSEVDTLSVTGNLATSNGAITVSVANGSLTVAGLVSAGPNGDVTLDVAGALNVAGQVSGNVLSVNASSTTALNTSVAALNANITGSGSSLTVTEANNLAIGAVGVRTNNGVIAITTVGGGSLVRSGNISAGTANVTLTLAGGTSGTGLVTADRLTLQAASSSSVNTTVNSVIANVTGAGQPLAIYQTGQDLVVPAGTVRTNNGNLTLSVDGVGNLTVLGNVTAGTAAVALSAGGAVNASTGQISGNALTVVANSTSALNTAVGSLTANITGAGSTLNVTEADNLTIDSGDVRTNGGDIAITTAGGGSLVRTGNISAGAANVTLTLAGGTSGTGLVTADRLTLQAASGSSVNTTVNSVLANVTGVGQPLTIAQTDRDLVVPAGNVRTNNGSLTLSVTGGNLTALGNVTAGTAAVTLSASGAVNASTGQISGNTLSVVANSTSALNTAVGSLVANITGAGSTLTVTEADNLTIGSGDVRTNNGFISITTAGGGSLVRTGNITAGTANVAINVAGGTSGAGLISGNELNLTAGGTSSVNSALSSLVANVTAGTLTVTDVDGLAIGAGGVRTNNAAIAITAGGGSVGGTGVINAGTANLSLTNTNGNISLTAVQGQVVASGLTVTATGTSALNTNVTTLNASITGPSQGLVVNQNRQLLLGTVGLNNGTLQLNADGGLAGSGLVSAGTAGFVVLNAAAGAVTLTAANQVTASGLTVNALNSSVLNTSVDSLTANITGAGQSLTVNEANGLQASASNIVARGDITLNLAAGSLTGVGGINANGGTANVVLNALGGALNPSGTITANTLTIRAVNTSSLTTNVSTLNANITGAGQSLAVTEASGLLLGTGNILTNNGDLTINVTTGGIGGTGRIATGTGNISLRTPAGNVTLNSSANQVAGNVLTVVALNSTAINTSINSLNANVTGAGSLTINEANNIAVTQARTANGPITLTTTANSTINVTSINAATGTSGNLTVVNGNLYIDAPGIVASQTANLSQAQSVTILSGDITANTVLLPAGQNAVLYEVTSPNDSGPGSLREVITRINSRGGTFPSTIIVNALTNVTLNSALPAMRYQMNVQGNNNLILNGAAAGSSSSGFTITSTSATTRSTVSGVTFQNFGAAGVDLVGARNISVTGITVTGSTIGFRASGNLSGTGVYNSTFTNNVIGATLASAQNLLVGVVPVTNVLSRNTFTGGTGYRGASTTGMSITGASAGTIVRANTFTGYPTAVSIVAATGMTFGGSVAGQGNAISNATTAGIYATGFCTGSSVIKTTFPSGVASTKQYVVATSRNLTIVK
jgi:hypothetical protein